LANQLQRRLDRLLKITESAERQSLKKVGLGRSEYAILNALVEEGKKPVNTLAEMIVLTSGSATTAVDRLARKEWVTRETDKKDRRIVHVKLTRSGRTIARRAQKLFDQYLNTTFEDLSEKEQKQLLKLLEKVHGGVDKVLNEPSS
jgi:DNA-binding MarR family transcriptional regulator